MHTVDLGCEVEHENYSMHALAFNGLVLDFLKSATYHWTAPHRVRDVVIQVSNLYYIWPLP